MSVQLDTVIVKERNWNEIESLILQNQESEIFVSQHRCDGFPMCLAASVKVRVDGKDLEQTLSYFWSGTEKSPCCVKAKSSFLADLRNNSIPQPLRDAMEKLKPHPQEHFLTLPNGREVSVLFVPKTIQEDKPWTPDRIYVGPFKGTVADISAEMQNSEFLAQLTKKAEEATATFDQGG